MILSHRLRASFLCSSYPQHTSHSCSLKQAVVLKRQRWGKRRASANDGRTALPEVAHQRRPPVSNAAHHKISDARWSHRGSYCVCITVGKFETLLRICKESSAAPQRWYLSILYPALHSSAACGRCTGAKHIGCQRFTVEIPVLGGGTVKMSVEELNPRVCYELWRTVE